MLDDERAIRDVVATWMQATRAGDTATVLSLMTDDVVFMVPGREPFGREEFARAAEAQADQTIEGEAEIIELRVLGDWAFIRTKIAITVTPADGEPISMRTNTLTLLQRDGGRWRLARDANLLAPHD
jgi:uncharacterized protein (TIGR02246 family)